MYKYTKKIVLYILLSEKNYWELHGDLTTDPTPFHQTLERLDTINGERQNSDLSGIVDYCYRILTGDDLDEDGQTMKRMKKITGHKQYVNRYEWLVYAIAKYYDNMKTRQVQPVENHVLDTIFVIRKSQDYLKSRVRTRKKMLKNYLESFDLLYDFKYNYYRGCPTHPARAHDSYRKKIVCNTRRLKIDSVGDNILPSKKLIHMQVMDISENRDYTYTPEQRNEIINYMLSKFTESYILGLNFVSCFPEVNDNELKLDLKHQGKPTRNNRIFEIRDYINHGQRVLDFTTDNNSFHDGVTFNFNGLRNTLPYMNFLGRVRNYRKFLEFTCSPIRDASNINNITFDDGLPIYKDYFRVPVDLSHVYYRPSSKQGYDSIKKNLERIIYKELDKSISNDNYSLSDIMIRYKNRIGSNNLTKIIPSLYPSLIELGNLYEKIQSYFPENKASSNIESFTDKFVNNVNDINAYYFINYYLSSGNRIDSDPNKVKDLSAVTIPSFFYYKIPNSNSLNKSLIFADDTINDTHDLSLADNYPIMLNDDRKEEYVNSTDRYWTYRDVRERNDLSDLTDSGNHSKVSDIQSILAGKKYITFNTINKYMKLSKKAPLPPSLEDHYYEFYELMLKGLIKNYIDISGQNIIGLIPDLILKLDTNMSEIKKTAIIAESVQNVIQRYFMWLINHSISNILKKTVFNETGKELDPPFIVKQPNSFVLSLSERPSIYPNSNISNDNFKEHGDNVAIYRINEKEKKDKGVFLLYSNDYTNNNIYRTFYKFILNKDIIIPMLEGSSSTYLTNNENRTPIFSVLRNYYYPIFVEFIFFLHFD